MVFPLIGDSYTSHRTIFFVTARHLEGESRLLQSLLRRIFRSLSVQGALLDTLSFTVLTISSTYPTEEHSSCIATVYDSLRRCTIENCRSLYQ